MTKLSIWKELKTQIAEYASIVQNKYNIYDLGLLAGIGQATIITNLYPETNDQIFQMFILNYVFMRGDDNICKVLVIEADL